MTSRPRVVHRVHPSRHPFRFALVVFATITVVLGSVFVVDVDGFQWSSAPLVIAFALVFTILCLIIVIPSSRWREVLYGNLGSLSACVFGVGIPYFAWVGAGRPVSGNFFATVAQVLPVLLLATLLDARRRVSLEDHQLALYVFVVAMGELASLTALAFDLQLNVGFFGLSCAAVLAAFAGLVVSLFAQRESSTNEEARR